MRTVGVEEEFLLVAADGTPVALAQAAVSGDLELELKEQMLETGTRPCLDAADLAADVLRQRRKAAAAAGSAGARLAALATSPLPVTSSVTARFRYHRIAAEYGLTAREQLTCGCHVHVGVADDDEGVAVLDRLGPWLPVLLALSANSPFWQGEDTGYASYRSQVWQRWPTAGPTAPFGSAGAYHRLIDDLVATGAALDRAMIYFDARLSARYPTVEVRVADVALRPADTVLLAVLTRALIETLARQAVAGGPPPPVRPEVLRAAGWRAGRAGLRGHLVDPVTLRPAPAVQAVGSLLDLLRPVLAEQGELERVAAGWQDLLARGTGAEEQRGWAAEGLPQAVDLAVAATIG